MQITRHIICLAFAVFCWSAQASTLARQPSPATRLAERFLWFCLDQRLSPSIVTSRAEQLGATEIRRQALDAQTRIWHWRDMNTLEKFMYSFSESQQPALSYSVLGCSVTGQVGQVHKVRAKLIRSKTIRMAKQISKVPSTVPSAAWFFIRDKEPFWVSLVGDAFGSMDTVTITLATHQGNELHQRHEHP